jgi:hypothetical protein
LTFLTSFTFFSLFSSRLFIARLHSFESVLLEVVVHGSLVEHAVTAEVFQITLLADEEVLLSTLVDLRKLIATVGTLFLLTFTLVIFECEPFSIRTLRSEIR